jgi:hypothetical protein
MSFNNKMRKKYHNVATVPQANTKIVATDTKPMLMT